MRQILLLIVAMLSAPLTAAEYYDAYRWRDVTKPDACILEYGKGFDGIIAFVYFKEAFEQKTVIEVFPNYQLFAVLRLYWQDGRSANAESLEFNGRSKRVVDKPVDEMLYLGSEESMQLLEHFKLGSFKPAMVLVDGHAIHMTPVETDFQREYAKFDQCIRTINTGR